MTTVVTITGTQAALLYELERVLNELAGTDADERAEAVIYGDGDWRVEFSNEAMEYRPEFDDGTIWVDVIGGQT